MVNSLEGVTAWWIGLTDSSDEGRWIWAHTLEDTSFSDWAEGRPQEGPNSNDCAMVDLMHQFKWSDEDCIMRKAATICQL